jgi:hypothetical protein
VAGRAAVGLDAAGECLGGALQGDEDVSGEGDVAAAVGGGAPFTDGIVERNLIFSIIIVFYCE